MANNILDKSAIEKLDQLSIQMPNVLHHLNKMSQDQGDMKKDVARISKEQVLMQAQLQSIETSIEEIPNKCPHREAIARSEQAVDRQRELEDRVTRHGEEIAGLKTSDKIYSGLNALIATVINLVVNGLNGNL